MLDVSLLHVVVSKRDTDTGYNREKIGCKNRSCTIAFRWSKHILQQRQS